MKSRLGELLAAGAVRLGLSVAVVLVAAAAQAVTMQVTDATATQPGQSVPVCVVLDAGGQQVAGTQNDLVWDGNCATLTKGSCQIMAPKKQLNDAFPSGSSFTMRAFVLALDNLDPIPSGNLYCCNFTSELSSSGSCPIRITNALAADPSGKAVQVTAQSGSIRFTGSSSGGGTGGGPGAAPGVAGGGGVVGGLVGQGGGGGAPPVYQGGGQAVPPTPIVIVPSGQQPPAEQPREAEEPAAALNETPAATASVQPTTAATEAPTKAPTKPAGTATAKPTVKPTPPPTAAQEAAKKEDGGGWFSCQVTTGQSTATPHALIAVLGLLALRLRRRRRR
jgi:MYXO-CTERM domain-containing protein